MAQVIRLAERRAVLELEALSGRTGLKGGLRPLELLKGIGCQGLGAREPGLDLQGS